MNTTPPTIKKTGWLGNDPILATMIIGVFVLIAVTIAISAAPSQGTILDSPEANLSGLQTGSINPDPILIAKFTVVLDSLEIKCPKADRSLIGDYIYTTTEMIKADGYSPTYLEIAYLMEAAIPESEIGTVTCAEIGGGIATLYGVYWE